MNNMSKVFKELSKKPQYETEQEILKNWNEQDILNINEIK